MTRLVAMILVMLASASLAHAQGAPQVPAPAAAATGEGAVAAVPAIPAPQGQMQPMDGQPPQMQPPVAGAVPAVPTGATPAAAPDRQSMMREIQEQGREATMKANALRATDPAGANKIIQDYYEMRNEKMKQIKELDKAARVKAVEERAQKREQAKVKQAAAQAERAAVKRDARNARDKQQEVGGRGFPRDKSSGANTQ